MKRKVELITRIQRRAIKSNKIIIYEFDLDDNKSFCYRSRVSINAFFNCNYKRFKNEKYTYWQLDEIDFDSWQRFCKKYKKPFPKIVKKKNLWDFYKTIRYNYKTKKYL